MLPHVLRCRQAYFERGMADRRTFTLLIPFLATPKLISFSPSQVDNRIRYGLAKGLDLGVVRKGDTIIAIQGWRAGGGSTNTVRPFPLAFGSLPRADRPLSPHRCVSSVSPPPTAASSSSPSTNSFKKYKLAGRCLRWEEAEEVEEWGEGFLVSLCVFVSLSCGGSKARFCHIIRLVLLRAERATERSRAERGRAGEEREETLGMHILQARHYTQNGGLSLEWHLLEKEDGQFG